MKIYTFQLVPDLLLFSMVGSSSNEDLVEKPLLAGLVGHFTFESGVQDKQGNFGSIELNGVKINNGCLQVDRGKWAQASYNSPRIFEKTLVSFVRIIELDENGGSVLTLS